MLAKLRSLYCPFCIPHSICFNIVFCNDVLYENREFSILELPTKKRYSSFLKKVFPFLKIYFKVKVLKTFFPYTVLCCLFQNIYEVRTMTNFWGSKKSVFQIWQVKGQQKSILIFILNSNIRTVQNEKNEVGSCFKYPSVQVIFSFYDCAQIWIQIWWNCNMVCVIPDFKFWNTSIQLYCGIWIWKLNLKLTAGSLNCDNFLKDFKFSCSERYEQ